jgi:hypothetical protein
MTGRATNPADREEESSGALMARTHLCEDTSPPDINWGVCLTEEDSGVLMSSVL